ncbi:MAG: hypothetical protein V4515_14775, partial [Chloroflexota bacterium]
AAAALAAYSTPVAHPVAASIIGKTVCAATTRPGPGDCYDLRLVFTDGSELLIEGGWIGGEITIQSTPAAPTTPAHQDPRMTDAP